LREQIDKQVKERLQGILEGLNAKAASFKACMEEMQILVDRARTNDNATAIARRPYFQAKRDLENEQVVRERLKLRIVQESIDATIPKTGIVDVIDPAEPGLRPVRPNKTVKHRPGNRSRPCRRHRLAFFIEYLDTSVKTIDDVERALQAPVLGVIPQNVGSLMDEGPDSPHAEAYRVLRTNIMFSQKDPKLNTITVVSGGAGEGKSTTIFNLATVFAQNGQRVLIVDSDLRRPSIHKILKVSNAIGLTNYLLKQNTLEEVIQTTTLSTLDFMPSGKLPSSSMGVLSSAQMKDLIRELKRRYDWVFFDSPPIMGVSDASILFERSGYGAAGNSISPISAADDHSRQADDSRKLAAICWVSFEQYQHGLRRELTTITVVTTTIITPSRMTRAQRSHHPKKDEAKVEIKPKY